MKTKLAQVTSCTACPFEGWSGYCTKDKSVKCGLEIPDKCPLPDAPSRELFKIASRWTWMRDLLDGEEVSDFALSFPEVQKLDDVMRARKVLEVINNIEGEQL